MAYLHKSKQRGMTYLELIIVLSIFTVISTIVIFSYREFQAKVDIKNLANEVALKIVEAQKSSTTGKLSPLTSSLTWKPAYGVYFNTVTPSQFVYFTDLDNSLYCSPPGCIDPYQIVGEVTDIINITKGNFIPANGIEVIGSGCPPTIPDVSITFKRPNSAPSFYSSVSLASCTISYISISISSTTNIIDKIRVYPSGRIQIN